MQTEYWWTAKTGIFWIFPPSTTGSQNFSARAPAFTTLEGDGTLICRTKNCKSISPPQRNRLPLSAYSRRFCEGKPSSALNFPTLGAAPEPPIPPAVANEPVPSKRAKSLSLAAAAESTRSTYECDGGRWQVHAHIEKTLKKRAARRTSTGSLPRKYPPAGAVFVTVKHGVNRRSTSKCGCAILRHNLVEQYHQCCDQAKELIGEL
jgi:hypothetical protein